MKLTKRQKEYIYSRLIELLVMNGENIEGLLFTPLSKIDFVKVILTIDYFEDKYEVEKELKFLNNFPQYQQLLK
jgi:hypothetical protein